MPTIFRLAVLERDLAVSLNRAENEDEAVKAVLASFSSFAPGCGVAALITLGERDIIESTGRRADAARELIAGSPGAESGGTAGAVLPLSDDRGALGRFAFAGGLGEERFALLIELYSRTAGMLSAALRRIAAARDRELLVRELRHRTRNSLQLIKHSISFLIGTLADEPPEILEAIEERLGALVIVHEMLSWTESTAHVSAESYFLHLAGALRRIIPDGVGTLIAYYDAEDDVSLPVERAVTIGLIVHELVMNTAKHSAAPYVRMSVRVDFTDGDLYLRYEEIAEGGCLERRSVYTAFTVPPPEAGPCRGSGIIDALVARARGRRIDAGTDTERFSAAFPVD